MDATTFSVKQH